MSLSHSPLFDDPEVRSVFPGSKLTTEIKLAMLISAQRERDKIFAEMQNSKPERILTMAMMARSLQAPVSAAPETPATLPEKKPPTFWDRLNPTSLLLVLGVVTCALASMKNSETTSLRNVTDINKSAAESNKGVAEVSKGLNETLRAELERANREREALRKQNAGTQELLQKALQTADKNSANAAQLTEVLNKLTTQGPSDQDKTQSGNATGK